MNKLINGTSYRATEQGYVIQRGKRQIYIIAKSANQGIEARKLIAQSVNSTTSSFNKLFLSGQKINSLGKNVSSLFL